jgi:RNA polymerase-binding transcription factor DksA
MGPRDLERYKRLLLTKLEKLSAARTEAASPVLAAGALEGDLIYQANADAEAELHVRLHQSDARLRRAIEEALARIRQGTGSYNY